MQLRRFLSNLAKVFLAVGALSVSAYAGADDQITNYSTSGSMGSLSYNPSCCPPSCCYNNYNNQCGCCGFPCCPAPDCGWGYNPPAYARCCCDTDCCNNDFLNSITFRADFLWWRASEEGIQLGTEEVTETTGTVGTPGRFREFNVAREKNPNFKYDPGFRIGFTHNCACDCWDFAVNWTHFHTKARARGFSDQDNGVFFFSCWERFLNIFPDFAEARYVLDMDLVDIEFGRKFYVSNCFVLRPDFGLRIARINQTYKVDSLSIFDGTAPFENFATQVKSRSDFLAVGPRVGIDVELHLDCGLTLFGCGAGTIAFGTFDNHSREHYEDFTTTGEIALSEFDYNEKNHAQRTSRAFTDLAFGIKWERCFEWCNRCHPVSLAFAWEHHAFWDMNNFNFKPAGFDPTGDETFADGPLGGCGKKHGDLFTQGLTVSLALGF
jgi:Legionella pneumophila major outer membrane protein precursor